MMGCPVKVRDLDFEGMRASCELPCVTMASDERKCVGKWLLCMRSESGVCYRNVVVKRLSVSVVNVERMP
jgi:hypothetical protein